jgi:hypothetical protein
MGRRVGGITLDARHTTALHGDLHRAGVETVVRVRGAHHVGGLGRVHPAIEAAPRRRACMVGLPALVACDGQT